MVEIVGSKLQELVLLLSVLNNKNKVEGTVLHILLIEQLSTILHGSLAQILVEIDENRMDRLQLTSLDVLHKLTALVAVHLDWRNGRLVNLLLVRVLSLTLVDECVSISLEILVRHVHHVLLGQFRESVHERHPFRPVTTCDEITVHLSGTTLIALQGAHLLQFVVVDDCLQHRFVEIALLQLLDFSKHQVLHLVESLTFLWQTNQHEFTVVGHPLIESHHFQHLLLLHEVHIEQTALAVLKHALNDFIVVGFLHLRSWHSPCENHHFLLQSPYFGTLNLSHRTFLLILQLRNWTAWLPIAKILVDDGNRLVEIQVTTHGDSHIVWHIVFLEVVLDVHNRRVLQVLLRTNGGLHTVRMMREEHLV